MFGKINDSFIKLCLWNLCMARDNDDTCLSRSFAGKLIHSMVAHLNAVSSLAVDPNGLYLLSGSKSIHDLAIWSLETKLWKYLCLIKILLSFLGHDCSIRLWNLDSKTCVQEITAHRKKFEESIHDVAFHPSKPYIASAGADALAKVFVWRRGSVVVWIQDIIH